TLHGTPKDISQQSRSPSLLSYSSAELPALFFERGRTSLKSAGVPADAAFEAIEDALQAELQSEVAPLTAGEGGGGLGVTLSVLGQDRRHGPQDRLLQVALITVFPCILVPSVFWAGFVRRVLLRDPPHVPGDERYRIQPFRAAQPGAGERSQRRFRPRELVGAHHPYADRGPQQPGMLAQDRPQSHSPGAQALPPAELWSADLRCGPVRGIGHEGKEIVAARYVPVQRHLRVTELRGHPLPRHRIDPLGSGKGDGGVDDAALGQLGAWAPARDAGRSPQ